MRKRRRGWWMKRGPSRNQGWAVETQSGGISRRAHVLIGVASSPPSMVLVLDSPGPCSVVSSCCGMVMSEAGLPVILWERMVEEERDPPPLKGQHSDVLVVWHEKAVFTYRSCFKYIFIVLLIIFTDLWKYILINILYECMKGITTQAQEHFRKSSA